MGRMLLVHGLHSDAKHKALVNVVSTGWHEQPLVIIFQLIIKKTFQLNIKNRKKTHKKRCGCTKWGDIKMG